MAFLLNFNRGLEACTQVLRVRLLYGVTIISVILLLVVFEPLTIIESVSSNFQETDASRKPPHRYSKLPDDYVDFRALSIPKILDLPEIRRFCAEDVVWKEDVYIHCYAIAMGAFNAINRVQNCIRWAMDAGAGLIIPTIISRDKVNLWDLTNPNATRVPVGFLLDEEFLWKLLRHNCPQMKLVNLTSLGPVEELEGLWGPVIYPVHKSLKKGQYKQYFEAHMAANFTRKNTSLNLPVIMNERDSLGAWNVISDTPEFQVDFHNLIYFNPHLVQLADSILEHLPREFFGMHMRIESDWRQVPGWPNETEIAQLAVGYNTTKDPMLFVACGQPELLVKFKELSREYGIRVYDKWDLALEKETAALKELAFDQLGIIDFLVLLRSQNFWGYGGSTFSHSVALSRHCYQFNDLVLRDNDAQQVLIGLLGTKAWIWDILW